MRLLIVRLLILACLFLGFGCAKKKTYQKPSSDDFASLTGKELPSWQYVQTKQDFEALRLYEGIYDSNKGLLSLSHKEMHIPKVVHFIWLGPRPFPLESVENVRTWMAKNPDWTFCFWTDQARPLPCPGMQLRWVHDLELDDLQGCFAKADNYAEKSDLLRCVILYQEGGVYVDHDVKCLKSFAPLNETFDFYCGIDMPHTSSLSSCVHTTNNLIGARPHHPILQAYRHSVAEKWDQIQADYPGVDRDTTLNRVLHRTFWLFAEAFREANNQDGNRDIVFPAYFFDAPKEELAIYAQHKYAGTWHETESPFEKMVRERLMLLSKKSNRLLLYLGMSVVLNFIGLIGLGVWINRCISRKIAESNRFQPGEE